MEGCAAQSVRLTIQWHAPQEAPIEGTRQRCLRQAQGAGDLLTLRTPHRLKFVHEAKRPSLARHEPDRTPEPLRGNARRLQSRIVNPQFTLHLRSSLIESSKTNRGALQSSTDIDIRPFQVSQWKIQANFVLAHALSTQAIEKCTQRWCHR